MHAVKIRIDVADEINGVWVDGKRMDSTAVGLDVDAETGIAIVRLTIHAGSVDAEMGGAQVEPTEEV